MMMQNKKLQGKVICLDLANSTPYKIKKGLIDVITSNGGNVSFVLNKKVNFLLKDDRESTTTYKCQSAFKMGIPVLHTSYIEECLSKMDTLAIKLRGFVIENNKNNENLKKGLVPTRNISYKSSSVLVDMSKIKAHYATDDPNDSIFERNGYILIKWVVVHEVAGQNSHIVEIQESKQVEESNKFRIRIEKYSKNKDQLDNVKHMYADNGAIIYKIFKQELNQYFNEKHYKFNFILPSRMVGSKALQYIAWKSKIDTLDDLNQPIAQLISYIWKEAIGELNDLLENEINDIKFTNDQINKAEIVLQKQKDSLEKEDESDYSSKFYKLIQFKAIHQKPITNKKFLAERFQICQVIRDMISVNEATNWNARASINSKYRSIGTYIQQLIPSSNEYRQIVDQLVQTRKQNKNIVINNIYEIIRPGEAQCYLDSLHNQKRLYHGSRVNNLVGILSRGLLLPKYVVNEMGVTKSDIGMLGAGIYFSDSVDTSLKYAHVSKTMNTRMVLVCDVALGNSKEYHEYDVALKEAPEGFQSVHGVKKREDVNSAFEDNEYVIYNVNQQRIRYLVEMQYEADGAAKAISYEANEHLDKDVETTFPECENKPIDINKLEKGKDALESVDCGLLNESGNRIPLKSVHVRAQLLDMVSKVIIYQEYENQETVPIEAKYVFPLDDNAAVCGFEAFINDKHVIGVCKEKEQAHREYKEAIEKGHGAYLMDQETPELFKVNVGNLPANCRCIIKMTYVAELEVQNERIVFKLPSHVAPWQTKGLEQEKMQETVYSKFISSMQRKATSFKASIIMPFEIRSIKSSTHALKLKQTACQAVCESQDPLNESMIIYIEIATIHMPRMLVEDHPQHKNSRACMVSFYPEFEAKALSNPNIHFLLDYSNSILSKTLVNIKKLFLLMIKNLPKTCLFNVSIFGSDFVELFPSCTNNSSQSIKKASEFVLNTRSNRGNTDVLPAISAYLMLKTGDINNFILISDGHISKSTEFLNAINSSKQNNLIQSSSNNSINRVFTCAVSEVANNHLLKMIAKLSGASYESYDAKCQSKWKEKVICVMDKVCQPAAIRDIKVQWEVHNNNEALQQAPAKLSALFNGRRVVVYGFVPNCQQATLKAEIDGMEMSTVVSCPELLITCGTVIHKLTAKALIDDWQCGVLCEDDRVKHELLRSQMIGKIIELSKLYSITSQYTSFLAIEERTVEEKKRKQSETPKIDALLSDDSDASSVDILPYMDYSSGKEDKEEGLFNFEKNLTMVIEKVEDSYAEFNDTEKADLFKFLLESKATLNTCLQSTDPIRLKHSLLLAREFKRLGHLDKATAVLKDSFDTAICMLDRLCEDSYKESTVLMQEMRDQLELISPLGNGVLLDYGPTSPRGSSTIIHDKPISSTSFSTPHFHAPTEVFTKELLSNFPKEKTKITSMFIKKAKKSIESNCNASKASTTESAEPMTSSNQVSLLTDKTADIFKLGFAGLVQEPLKATATSTSTSTALFTMQQQQQQQPLLFELATVALQPPMPLFTNSSNNTLPHPGEIRGGLAPPATVQPLFQSPFIIPSSASQQPLPPPPTVFSNTFSFGYSGPKPAAPAAQQQTFSSSTVTRARAASPSLFGSSSSGFGGSNFTGWGQTSTAGFGAVPHVPSRASVSSFGAFGATTGEFAFAAPVSVPMNNFFAPSATGFGSGAERSVNFEGSSMMFSKPQKAIPTASQPSNGLFFGKTTASRAGSEVVSFSSSERERDRDRSRERENENIIAEMNKKLHETQKLTKNLMSELAVQNECLSVKQIMQENINKVIARGDNLDELMAKSEKLAASAEKFYKNSSRVNKGFFWSPSSPIKSDGSDFQSSSAAFKAKEYSFSNTFVFEPQASQSITSEKQFWNLIQIQWKNAVLQNVEGFKQNDYLKLKQLFFSHPLKNGEYFDISASTIERIFGIRCEPLLQYLINNGLNSLGEAIASELKQMILHLIICYFISVILHNEDSLCFDSVSNLKMFLIEKINLNDDMKKNVSICFNYVEKIQNKYPLACSSLELGRNWNQFVSSWFKF